MTNFMLIKSRMPVVFFMDESNDNDNFAQASKLFMLNCREETVNFLVHWLVLILNHM